VSRKDGFRDEAIKTGADKYSPEFDGFGGRENDTSKELY